MTSEKPAARCQLRVKERMLLTPPMSVKAARRLVTEDRLRRSWRGHSSSWRESTLRPSRDSFSNWTLRLPNEETLPVREKPPRSYWSQVGCWFLEAAIFSPMGRPEECTKERTEQTEALPVRSGQVRSGSGTAGVELVERREGSWSPGLGPRLILDSPGLAQGRL